MLWKNIVLPQCHYNGGKGGWWRTTRSRLLDAAKQRQRQHQRYISTQLALHLLDLTERPTCSKQLRYAYFEAAKLCHPDSSRARQNDNNNNSAECGDFNNNNNNNQETENLTERFLLLTQAYELLRQQQGDFEFESVHDISLNEEQEYRKACKEVLGLDAETVEESKKCPLFREWLKGRTDAALLWQGFITKHGGLLPMLRSASLKLEQGDIAGPKRRRRVR